MHFQPLVTQKFHLASGMRSGQGKVHIHLQRACVGAVLLKCSGCPQAGRSSGSSSTIQQGIVVVDTSFEIDVEVVPKQHDTASPRSAKSSCRSAANAANMDMLPALVARKAIDQDRISEIGDA